MRRKRKPVDHVNHERWLISYADFITLLFAFFVVMFAASVTNKEKARSVSAAVEQALSGGMSARDTRSHPKNEKSAPAGGVSDLSSSLQVLRKQLAAEITSGKMKLSLQERGLVVTLSEDGFFEQGKDIIQPATYAAFQKVAAAIQKLPNAVRLEGHTDSVPIHNSRFRNNWDLSTSRALAILSLLEETYSIDRTRLSAAGYADTVPLESNETEPGRAHNRRVDLVILSTSASASEPTAKTR